MFRALLIAALVCIATTARAGDYITTESPDDVQTTFDRLQKALGNRGLKAFVEVDHAKGAVNVGQTLAPSKVLIFGNPKLGTALMQINPEIGVDLPLKMSVWQAADGRTRVTYRSADSLAAAHGMDPNAPPFKQMTLALAALAKAAAGM
ncbi:MAG: DUF302 domain-containing protein [Chromatiales bacterium]|nr:DUF302 domain-containing protein [Chromatiales bacterium]